MADNRRRRFLIDGPVQLGLLHRVGIYAAYCLTTATLLVFFWRTVTEPGIRPHQHLISAVRDSAPLLVALLAILPFVAYDLLKLTNRFAGPVYRVRRTLDSLNRGEVIPPVKFREGDFWWDLAEKLNLLAGRLEQLRTPEPKPAVEALPPSETVEEATSA